jgi:site-specific recombinase XerD
MQKIITFESSVGSAMAAADSNATNTSSKTLLNAVLDGSTATMDASERYLAASHSPATLKAYALDIRMFIAGGGHIPCSPAVLIKYLTQEAENLSISTLVRRITAVHRGHLEISAKSPARDAKVKKLMMGIKRVKGTKQRQVNALIKDDLLSALVMAEQQFHPLKIARDRALLLCGWSCGLRRSELVSIRTEHITRLSNGIEIVLPRSKTDQFGATRTVYMPMASSERRCPCRALEKWLQLSGINEGFVFRSVNRHGKLTGNGLTSHAVAYVVKASVERAGGDASAFSGHSLRSGLVTSAVEAGMQPHQIMEITGHKSMTTLQKYIRIHERRKMASLL